MTYLAWKILVDKGIFTGMVSKSDFGLFCRLASKQAYGLSRGLVNRSNSDMFSYKG